MTWTNPTGGFCQDAYELPGLLLTCRCGRVFTSKDDGRITFSAGWKEFELRALQEAAAPLPEPQCVFEHWPDQLNADPLSLWILGAVLLDQGRWLAFIKIKGIAMPEFQVSYDIA